MTAMTFEQFQATREAVSDLANASVNIAPEWFEDENGNVRTVAGFVYDGDCYIELTEDGKFGLTICNESEVSNELETLERKLYQWAVDEQLFD